jgi:hypothetical protein
LFALFLPNLQQLKTRLSEWQPNDSLPFWAAKKASLLAEIGQMSDAEQVLEQSLDTIRATLKVTPPKADYRPLSEEALVMVLLRAVRQRSLLTDPGSSDLRRQRREFRERWHALRQHRCDPWHELVRSPHWRASRHFGHRLRVIPRPTGWTNRAWWRIRRSSSPVTRERFLIR